MLNGASQVTQDKFRNDNLCLVKCAFGIQFFQIQENRCLEVGGKGHLFSYMLHPFSYMLLNGTNQLDKSLFLN